MGPPSHTVCITDVNAKLGPIPKQINGCDASRLNQAKVGHRKNSNVSKHKVVSHNYEHVFYYLSSLITSDMEDWVKKGSISSGRHTKVEEDKIHQITQITETCLLIPYAFG